MTTTQPTPEPASPASPRSLRPLLLNILPALLLGSLLATLALLAAGRTLGLFFAGVGIVTLIAPPLALAEPTVPRRLAVAAALVGILAGSWLSTVAGGMVSMGEWAAAVLTLLALVLALVGVALSLTRLHVESSLAAALTVVLGLAWLSWPIWMAPHLRGKQGEEVAAALIAPHPLFAINIALREPFPVPWPQQRLAYRLTNLGDDIIYEMPRGVAYSVTLHGVLAAFLIGFSAVPSMMRPNRRA